MKNYENCTVMSIEYECSDTIEKQGPRDAITKYLKKGYYVKEERNGYWVLVKPSRVMVTVKNSDGIQSDNMKHDILNYYGKQKISKKIVEKFAQDVEKAKIDIFFDGKGNYLITAAS